MSGNSFTPEFDLDLPQWRRDIRTFIDSTLNELSEISNQLSSEFADPMVRRNRSVEQNSGSGTVESSGSDRLAKLKEKLAQKVK